MSNKSFWAEKRSQFFAGSVSGCSSAIVFQPLDVIKTRQQGVVGSMGMMKTTRVVMIEDGLLGLWKGITPSVIRVFFGVGLYFSTLNTILKNPIGSDKKDTALRTFLAGVAARSSVAALMNPVSVVKTRMEWATGSHSNTYSVFKQICKNEGARGLFSGVVPTLIRDAPYSGLYVAFYQQIKQIHNKVIPTENRPHWKDTAINMNSSLIGAAVATALTHPADVLKTRFQLVSTVEASTAAAGVNYKYNGVVDAMKSIIKTEGITGLFSGVLPRVLRRMGSSVIVWTLYEERMRSKKRNEDQPKKF
eukprot:TRINITY_DN778015_c0_g1_i1.p1 TRINITY_DN778015_c0_g1~~TRINITY_DN778015_c0_g1_i1.p1  ORF type:complete len:305 (-),score=68.13 TRINITY_DN778015_c0_g1_i1:768-1682(-)